MNDYWACNFDDPDSVMPYSWTTEPPTREGWYWAKEKKYSGAIIVKVYKSNSQGLMKCTQSGNEDIFGLEDFSHWLGPLPEPEPPKG